MTYTLEEIKSHGMRLHYNTFLGIIFNSFAAYIILLHSPTIMGIYKYYILSTVFFAFLMDFHLTFIFGTFPLFPYHAGCPAGISKYLGPFWGTAVQLGIFHFTLAFCGLSVFFGLVYQYLSITYSKHFLQTFHGRICVGIFMLIYPLPSFILYLLNYSYPQFLENLKINDPNLVEFFIAASCDGQVFTNFSIVYLGVGSTQILFVAILTTIILFKIIKQLSAMKHHLSPTTLKMRQQYFKTLIIQFFLPVIFIVIPFIFLIAMIFLNVGGINAYSQICIQFMSLHSVANAITIMVVIKSYRKVLHQCFTTVSLIFKKDYVDTKSSTVFVP